jgi:hypothetical protein
MFTYVYIEKKKSSSPEPAGQDCNQTWYKHILHDGLDGKSNLFK